MIAPMELVQPERGAYRLISGYDVGIIGVDGRDYTSNLIVTRTRVIESWHGGDDLEGLGLDSFAELLDAPPGEERAEIVLLGTGATHRFPAPALVRDLAREGVALEAMNTRAACRTYSVLVDESRPVAAALIQIRA